MTRPTPTRLTLAMLALATSAPAALAQQGPAELWVLRGASSSPQVREVDETVPVRNAVVFTSSVSESPEVEFDGSSFVLVSINSNVVEVWSQAGVRESTAPLDFSASLEGNSVITALEAYQGVMYAAATVRGGGTQTELGVLEPSTGAFTPIGPLSFSAPISGLAHDGAAMYAIQGGGGNPARLYTVDLTTGAATLAATTDRQFSALEFGADGVLYALESTNGFALITIDPTTGATTDIDPSNDVVGEALTSSFVVPAPSDCSGDVDGDGDTDVFDFSDLAASFGAGPGATRQQGDLTGDGFVDVFDFSELAADFGCGEQ